MSACSTCSVTTELSEPQAAVLFPVKQDTPRDLTTDGVLVLSSTTIGAISSFLNRMNDLLELYQFTRKSGNLSNC